MQDALDAEFPFLALRGKGFPSLRRVCSSRLQVAKKSLVHSSNVNDNILFRFIIIYNMMMSKKYIYIIILLYIIYEEEEEVQLCTVVLWKQYNGGEW